MTLAQISYFSRQTIKYGFFFIVFIIVGGAVFKTGWGIYRTLIPPAPAPPTTKFGILSAIPLPKTQTQNYKYTLQTPDGELPKFAPSLPVYLMPQSQSTLVNTEEAVKTANTLEFTSTPEKVAPAVYRFTNTQVPKTLDINIINKTFSISYNLSAKPELLNMRPSSSNEAKQIAENYLNRNNLLSEDYHAENIEIEYLQSSPTELIPVSSLSEANFIRVNFFRKNYSNLPVVTPKKTLANVWLILSGEDYGPSQIIAGEYHHFPVDETQSSTYPIKTAQQAWQELNTGKATIITPLPENKVDVTISRIGLAYFDAGKAQQFFQPIVVFEGEGFTAYLPAVTDTFYNPTTQQ